MPNCKTHQWVGALAGGLDACYQAQGKPHSDAVLETIGGAIGGYVAGMLPDVLEPAVSPWHRDVGHSVTVGGGVLVLRATLAQWAQQCRDKAQNCSAILMIAVPGTNIFVPASVTPFNQLVSSLAELFWKLLAGFLNGLSAGYASHLLLDAMTPRGIPLLTTRF
ncbi:MAG TPA: metal-dependent hydrolase [Candidatus Angelobacter sp.]|nr:metal-dependent hydrolase [Candidatus Angelobacter sp.]